MGKVRCIKDFRCEVCGIPGMLRIFLKNYARVRHYKSMKDGKTHFIYHKQNISYVNKLLNKASYDQSGQNNIDLNLNILSHNNRNVRAGSLARLGHPLDVRKVAGSNPVRPTKLNFQNKAIFDGISENKVKFT